MTDLARTDVLLLAFVRPDLLAQAVEPLKDGGVGRVFLALDGPRPDHPGDAALIAECERIVRAALGDTCTIEVLRRATNLGMKRACVEAIDWFFTRTDAGIIIEEDCVVGPTFLPYAGELLARHRDDHMVMGICGTVFIGAPAAPDGASYRFVRNFGVWGWATWARAWRMNDPWLEDLTDGDLDAVLRRQGATSLPFRRYWTSLIRACRDGRNPNWDFPWTFSVWRAGGLFIRPDRNLVSNIGHDERATQTTAADPRLSRLPVTPMAFPLVHPAEVRQDVAFDRWSDRRIKGIGWPLLVKSAVRRAETRIRARLARSGGQNA